MALSDFLYNRNTGMSPALDLTAAVLAITGANKQADRLSGAYAPNAYDQAYQQQIKYYSDLIQKTTGAAADTSSPEFQRRMQARMDEITRASTDAMRQSQALSAARAGRGLSGTINPERRDEAMLRGQGQLRSQAEAQARAEVLKEMADAATLGQNAARSVIPATAVGVANERARQVGQAQNQNVQTANQSATLMALAKSALPYILKGMDPAKATQVVGQLSQTGQTAAPFSRLPGYQQTGPTQVTGGVSQMGADPFGLGQSGQQFSGLPDFTAPGAPDASDWWAQDTSAQWPGAETQLPDFTAPGAPDASDWWAQDTSVQWPSVGDFQLPDFTMPDFGGFGMDPSDWWALDSSVNW